MSAGSIPSQFLEADGDVFTAPADWQIGPYHLNAEGYTRLDPGSYEDAVTRYLAEELNSGSYYPADDVILLSREDPYQHEHELRHRIDTMYRRARDGADPNSEAIFDTVGFTPSDTAETVTDTDFAQRYDIDRRDTAALVLGPRDYVRFQRAKIRTLTEIHGGIPVLEHGRDVRELPAYYLEPTHPASDATPPVEKLPAYGFEPSEIHVANTALKRIDQDVDFRIGPFLEATSNIESVAELLATGQRLPRVSPWKADRLNGDLCRGR